MTDAVTSEPTLENGHRSQEIYCTVVQSSVYNLRVFYKYYRRRSYVIVISFTDLESLSWRISAALLSHRQLMAQPELEAKFLDVRVHPLSPKLF